MRVAIYCRLSEEDRGKQSADEDSNSIRNQKSMLLQYSLEQNWDVFRIYSDDDYTGSDRSRPGFKALLRDAEARKFDIVLCKSQSRFTRELELVEKYIHGLFPLWGIRFISIVDHADTANRGNKKSRQINGLVNEWYLEDMSENIRSVLNNRRQNGFHIGSFALYGYLKDPAQKGHLIVDREAAAVVREIFVLFSRGYGKTAIARILNDRGIPNPTEYKRIHGLSYRQAAQTSSHLWTYATISGILKNEMYIGNMVQGKYGSASYKTKVNRPRPKEKWYRVEKTHEAIIGQELWDRVQSLLQERSKPFSSGKIGLFAGKVRCANCGCVMRSSKNRGKHYLQCRTHHLSKDSCVGAFISVEKLEQLVLDELTNFTNLYLDSDVLMERINVFRKDQTQQKRLLRDLDRYQQKLEEYAKGIRHLYLDKTKDILSEADFITLSAQFSEKKEHFTSLIKQTEAELEVLAARLSCADSSNLLQQYLNPPHLTREMVGHFIDHITVGKRAPGERHPPVEIHWAF